MTHFSHGHFFHGHSPDFSHGHFHIVYSPDFSHGHFFKRNAVHPQTWNQLQRKFSIVFPKVDALSTCSPCQIDECTEAMFCLSSGLTSLCEGYVLENACT